MQYDLPVAPGASVTFNLEYYVPNRGVPTPVFTVALSQPVVLPAPVGQPFAVDKITLLQPGRILLEFSSVAGTLYGIQYSSDMVTWKPAGMPFTAGGNRVQWIDYGPPKTETPPLGARFYQVVRFQ